MMDTPMIAKAAGGTEKGGEWQLVDTPMTAKAAAGGTEKGGEMDTAGSPSGSASNGVVARHFRRSDFVESQVARSPRS